MTTFLTIATSLINPTSATSNSSNAEKIRKDQWHLRFLKAAEAQGISRGKGTIVAIPDTGVFPHPDLEHNLLPGTDVSEDGDGRRDDDSHGTSMAGLVAAHGSPKGLGALGIAPEAKILPIRSRQIDGKGDTEELAASVEWATLHGADVISISAVAGASRRLQQAIRTALQADIVVVAAAGNKPFDISIGYPASEEGVIAVGGVDQAGELAAVSVTGPTVDVVAPAVDIYSTSYGGKYSKGTGTSSATAIVAGAAALIRSKYPDLPAAEVAHRLTATAVDKGPPGRDDEYGYGVIDLVAALTADVPPLGFESATAHATAKSGPVTTAVAEPAGNDGGDGGATARGLATLSVIVAAGGAWALVARRRRRGDNPPPRISR
ncbi:type VII secretion-associated serine protease mycosin [Micromonospora sp. NBC_01405]|uniref:type VII secretion-associated serine protease mycosin n=1 Tax=Micromonospora sp. NBC_01405 TaxID=2903589 RepID=UPI003250FEEE